MNEHYKRYNRQIALPEIGISGQRKLTDAKVLVIGAGGLGCPVLQNLAAAGVGCIGIVDGDLVAETNLNRQFLYTKKDCGKNKADVAAAVISNQNPEIEVVAYPTHFATGNAFEIISAYQIVVDCTDNLEVRYLINDVTLVKQIPMVYASIHRFEGQLSVFNLGNGPSYRCLFPASENLDVINCNDAGVLGVLPSMLGNMQATEVLKIILEIGEILSGKLLVYDALDQQIQTISIKRNESEIEKGMQNGQSILNQNVENVGAIEAVDFVKMATENSHLLIDIRESHEERIDLPNIINIPLDQLEDYLTTADIQKPIVLCCYSGNNSQLAAKYLMNNGFKNIAHLQNGISSLTQNTAP